MVEFWSIWLHGRWVLSEEPQLLSSAEVSDLSPEAQAHINRPTVPHSR